MDIMCRKEQQQFELIQRYYFLLMDRSFYSSRKTTKYCTPRPNGYRMVLKMRNGETCDKASQLLNSSEKLSQQHSTSSFIPRRPPSEEPFRSTSLSAYQQQPSKPNQLTLEQIEQTLDSLIQQKLQKIQATPLPDKQLNKELQNIIGAVNGMTEGNEDKNIDTINMKIEILEKLIAENCTELEAYKKYYHERRTNRKQVQPVPLFKSLEILKEATKEAIERTSKPIHYSTIAKSSFVRPKNPHLQKIKPRLYTINNQPMPRSTYKREYLKYNVMPKCNYKNIDNNILKSSSGILPKSSYKESYTPKKLEHINIKELDCYKDKFKNLKVSYQLQRSSPVQKDSLSFCSMSRTKRFPPEQKHYIKNLVSESRLNFQGKMGKQAIIKHKNLNKLKYSYKAIARA